MQVFVGGLFESLVYHVSVNPETREVWFLIWDPQNKKFDLVDADQCRPLNVSSQSFETGKKLAERAGRAQEIERNNAELAKLKKFDEMQEKRSKEQQ